jgi:acetyltransferase-like isoleucine patch superfamily enzyme
LLLLPPLFFHQGYSDDILYGIWQEDGVYVGTGAKIINQLEIGEYTIVGAGAVVSKTLPAHCTAVGVPAKAIKIQE